MQQEKILITITIPWPDNKISNNIMNTQQTLQSFFQVVGFRNRIYFQEVINRTFSLQVSLCTHRAIWLFHNSHLRRQHKLNSHLIEHKLPVKFSDDKMQVSASIVLMQAVKRISQNLKLPQADPSTKYVLRNRDI